MIHGNGEDGGVWCGQDWRRGMETKTSGVSDEDMRSTIDSVVRIWSP